MSYPEFSYQSAAIALLGSGAVIYVVVKQGRNKDVEAVYTFDNHADALRCRRDLKLDSHCLWGAAVGSYDLAKN